MSPRLRWLALLLSATSLAATVLALDPPDRRPGYRPAAYAVKGAKVVVSPEKTIDEGTVVVRGGVIEAVGPANEIDVPADAETIDGKGLVVYAGLLDLYTTLGVPAGVNRSETGPGRSIAYTEYALASTAPDNRAGLTPEFQVASVVELPEATAVERRKLGFTGLLAAPGGSIGAGQSALVSLAGLPRREALIRPSVGLHISLRPPFEPPPPPSPDESPNETRRRFAGRVIGYPMSLMGVVSHLRQAMLDAEHNHVLRAEHEANAGPRPPFDPCLEALHAAKAKQVPIWWEANSRDEIHRALDLASEFGVTSVIVGGREAAKVADRLKAENVPVVFRLNFGDEPKTSTDPDDSAGIEPARVRANRLAKWKEHVATPAALAKAGVRFAFATDGLDKAETVHDQVRKAIDAGLKLADALDAWTRDAAEIVGLGDRMGKIEAGYAGSLIVMSGGLDDPKGKVRHVLIDGFRFDVDKEDKSKGKGKSKSKDDAPKTEEAKTKAAAEAAEPPKTQEDQPPKQPAAEVATELEEDRKPTLQTGGNVLIKGAAILTVGPAGTIANGSILVRDGKIAAVGREVEAPEGVKVIDAEGLVAMPGIIDTHSHMAISGGVNEMSLSIVPEVRVADVVNGDDPTIYRALAGGTTTARLLHGSANTIGGQDVVIKLRHGQAGRDLILKDARRPQGVKFALGENVTRQSFRSVGRFPSTRMGVEAVIERALEEGKAYRAALTAHRAGVLKGQAGPPPRRDLRLEALGEIAAGKMKIHSHCYRSDEILMLLRVAQRHGIRVQSLQHVLEGYKVAAEIAAHGASASTFSDWWAYKVEAFDAIPFNAALLTEAGARVCIKSDSEELVRHLNLEAAKMVKYGGVSEQQALEMITINPARELGLEHRLGSIEVGKDADIALFNAHPFDSFARVEFSLIDGEVWFQHKESRSLDRPKMPSSDSRDKTITIPAVAKGVYALTGATLHPVSGPDVKDGTLIVADGEIAAIGGPDVEVPTDAVTVDLRGLDVWPGLIDAGTVIGLFEVGSLSETQDFADLAPFQPELRASAALHPDSELVPVTRANGILSAYVQPQGGSISGQGCLIALDGWVPSEMVVADGLALNVNIPRYVTINPSLGRTRTGSNDPNAKRSERLDAIKEQFRRALDYDKVVVAARDGKSSSPVPDPRLSALVPFAKGEKPVILRADRQVEILDALELAKDLKLKSIISGGLEAWKVADALKEAKVPVLVSGTLRLPADATDPFDAAYANPARLHAAGVPFAIRSIGEGADQATASRNLPYEAAMAVAFGLPEAEAIKSITLAPATILGVADRLGSLESGKRADLVITAGSILQPTTEVKALFIGGKPLPPESRHTRLHAKYRQRLAQVKAGTAPLGLEKPNATIARPSGPAPAATPADRR